MNFKITLLTGACALALAACGGNDTASQDTASPAGSPAAGPSDTAPASTAPASGTTPAGTAPAGQSGVDGGTGTHAGTGTGTDAGAAPATAGQAAGDEAVVSNCETTIEGNDAMRFNVSSITVPSSCSDFTINLQHTGQLPVAAMGHNVVITSNANFQSVAADGMAAGADNDYVKPDDDRVIAHTELVGGGESTSVTFPVSALQEGGPYEFFCSFPGHSALMRGTIQVGG